VLRRRCIVCVPRLEEERTPRARRQYCDDGVVEPPHLAIAMHRDTVACVAVVLEPEPVEAHVVSSLDRLLRFREHGMMRSAEGTDRAEAWLLDIALVRPDAPLLPRDRGLEVGVVL